VDELHRLGQLVLGHRGKLRKLDLALDDPLFVCQLLALRLGVILCHARREPQTEDITLEHDARNQTFQLTLPEGWDKLYPQSAHLLREEVTAWQKTSWRFALHISRQDHAIHIGM
jgi:exopolyphosphatase / guanosine-5'-triphosphate,3'-diphosphate pyrophosphatase